MKLRKEIDRKYYLRNADKIRARNRESKAKKKQKFLLENQKYYGAESIKILLSLKGYTELSQQKYKLWADFCWTLKDINQEISGITSLMK